MKSVLKSCFSIIWLPEKYKTLEKSVEENESGLELNFRKGAVALVPIFNSEVGRGIDSTFITMDGLEKIYLSSWKDLDPDTTYSLKVRWDIATVLYNSTDEFATILEDTTQITEGATWQISNL